MGKAQHFEDLKKLVPDCFLWILTNFLWGNVCVYPEDSNSYKIALMNEQPYKSVSFEWLSRSGDSAENIRDESFGEQGWVEYPMPPEVGHGGYEALDLALGMTYVHSALKFTPAMLGQQLPIMDVEVSFNEPSFQAMSLRGFHGGIKEDFPPALLAPSTGNDVFRYTKQYHSIFTVDASFSGETCHVSLGRTMLDRLIGSDVAQAVLNGLNIKNSPSVVIQSVPLHISNLLFHASNPTLTGSAKKLFCQAKCLEYLVALTHYVCASAEVEPDSSQTSRNRARNIQTQLMNCEGKPPTLDQLAEEYGRSAQLLNSEFILEFGKSIYAFTMDHRLAQAHSALQQTDVTIKQISAQMGYSHVNNFTVAFKRKFGYPPGSLRKK